MDNRQDNTNKTLDFCKKYWFKLLVLFLILHLYALIKEQGEGIKSIDMINYELRTDIDDKIRYLEDTAKLDTEIEHIKRLNIEIGNLENRAYKLELAVDNLYSNIVEIESNSKNE